ncbi:unnamed protein product, partial [Rotaria sp. Silwood2]
SIEQVKSHQTYQLHNFKIVSNISTSSSDEESTTDDETETITYELRQGWTLIEPNNNTRCSPEQINFLNKKYEEGKNNGSKWNANAVFEEMQNKQDENGTFIVDPSQFLTTSQIKSYFSRLAGAQRLHGSQSQSYSKEINNDYNEEETEEAEKDFDSILVELQEQSIRVMAKDRFNKLQKSQS